MPDDALGAKSVVDFDQHDGSVSLAAYLPAVVRAGTPGDTDREGFADWATPAG